jgi:DNA-binding transcriptional regulator GbsR (MarR family)
MADELTKAREDLIRELGRLSSFAGFNKAMGQIYGVLYLSEKPISLTEIAGQLGISKGNASLNIKTMERWGLIHPINRSGDRQDYYEAETNFWKIIHDIITERDKKEIDHIIGAISSILDSVRESGSDKCNKENQFYQERLGKMVDFGNAVNQLMQASLTLNNFRSNVLMPSDQNKETSRRIQIDE